MKFCKRTSPDGLDCDISYRANGRYPEGSGELEHSGLSLISQKGVMDAHFTQKPMSIFERIQLKVPSETDEKGISFIKDVPHRVSLGEHVFENLKQAIISGDVPNGERLVENRIAESLNISRTPVREALHKLEKEGLLTKRRRGGFIVSGFDRESIEETFGIRSALESYAARLAAEKHRKGDLKKLEKKIEEFQSGLALSRLNILPEINTEFHDLLYALSQSPKLIRMINELRDPIYRFRRIILLREDLAEESNADHKRMLEQIRNRDADGVEQLVRKHILRGKAAVLEEIESEGLTQ